MSMPRQTAAQSAASRGMFPNDQEIIMATRKDNQVVTCTTVGETLAIHVKGIGDVEFDAGQAHASNRAYAMMHGFKQRIVDAAALSRDPDTGQPATPLQKFEAIQAMVQHYHTGTADWGTRTAAGPRETGGLTLRAIAAVYGWESADIAKERVEKLAAKRGADYKAMLKLLAGSEKVGAEITRMRAAKGGVAANEALAELCGETEGE